MEPVEMNVPSMFLVCLVVGLMCVRPVFCDDIRLTDTVVPINYTLDLKIENFTVEGILDIIVDVQRNTENITLYASNLNISVDQVYISPLLDPSYKNKVSTNQSDELLELYTMVFEDPLLKYNTPYKLHIPYRKVISEDLSGFYSTSYSDDKGNKSSFGVTQFAPTAARRAFPCFDEPQFRTTFQLTISVDKRLDALSNMPQASVITTNEKKVITFETSPPMPSYLMAWVIYNNDTFTKMPASKTSHQISVWGPKHLINKGVLNQARNAAPALMEALEQFTGIQYVLPKMDLILVPDFYYGAMENWGLVNFRSNYLVWEEGVSTELDLQHALLTIAHEFVHQWFGNAVTLRTWGTTWLNEGFARLLQFSTLDKLQPDWRLSEQMVVGILQPALELDSLPSEPLTTRPSTEEEIQATFGPITYNKGASVLRMISSVTGPEIFQKACQRYLIKVSKRDGVATPYDLWSALQTEIDRLSQPLLPTNITDFVDNWFNQSGYPLVTVTNTSDSRVVIKQQHFQLSGNATNSKWWVPLHYTMQESDADYSLWLPPNGTELLSSNGWILFNLGQTGFYRVNYDLANWKLLSTQLNSEATKIPVLNRAQLLDDAFNLARAKMLLYSVPLGMSMYLYDGEPDPVPWNAALRAFRYMDDAAFNTSHRDLFREYFLLVMEPSIQKLSFSEPSNDNHVTKLCRMNILKHACHFNHKGCVSKAAEMLNEWLSGNGTSFSPDVRSALLCAAVMNSSETEWNQLYEKYNTSVYEPSNDALILAALACTHDDFLLQSYLALATFEDLGVRRQDVKQVFQAVSSNPRNADMVLHFITDHFYNITTRLFSQMAAANLLSYPMPFLSRREQAEHLEAFLSNNTGLQANVKLTLTKMATKIHGNSLQNNTDLLIAIADWVEENKDKVGKKSDAGHSFCSALLIVLLLSFKFSVA